MKFLSLEFKKGKPNLPLKVEKAKVDEVLTKITYYTLCRTKLEALQNGEKHVSSSLLKKILIEANHCW